MQSVGFKEWAVVCDAIARGEQTIILRKGGIAEGRAGFQFKHDAFFLFPTSYHAQVEKTRGSRREIPAQREGEIELRVFAKVEFAELVTSWEAAERLEPFHIWTHDVVRERFDYANAPGIHVAFIRAFRLSQPWIIPDLPAYGGCRSWVKLPELRNEISLVPVLDDAEYESRRARVQAIIDRAAPATTTC